MLPYAYLPVSRQSGSGEQRGSFSRKQRREQARAQRRAAEAAEAAGVRRHRLYQLVAVIVTVVVIIAVILAITSGKGSGGPAALTSKSARKEALKAVNALLKGIPESGETLGAAGAPVTMQYYGDLECSYCREFTLDALPGIVAEDVRSGKLKIEYRSEETATRNPRTFLSQQIAAYAAGKQDLGWYYIELFYHEQGEEDSGYVTERYLQDLARQVHGLSLARWSADRGEESLANAVAEDERAFTKLIAAAGVREAGTPSFAIGKTGKTLHLFEPSSLTESAAFESAIAKLAS